jgi:hypothetical protein
MSESRLLSRCGAGEIITAEIRIRSLPDAEFRVNIIVPIRFKN